MAQRTELYIDSEGVKRGYYVYLHKDRTTGEVFYVGKGTGRRASNTKRRHPKWKERVSSLTNGWRVELVKQDLSEIEAFELEAELVEKYGGCAANGGTLTNWVPGGEDPVSSRLEIQFDDGGWSAAYCKARKFKELKRDKEEDTVRDLNKSLEPIVGNLDVLKEEADDRDDEKLSDSVADLECIVEGLRDVSSDFLRRRVSWKDFALGLEDATDDFEWELEDSAGYHKKVKRLLKSAFELTAKFLGRIDSGNRREAEDTAARITGKD